MRIPLPLPLLPRLEIRVPPPPVVVHQDLLLLVSGVRPGLVLVEVLVPPLLPGPGVGLLVPGVILLIPVEPVLLVPLGLLGLLLLLLPLLLAVADVLLALDLLLPTFLVLLVLLGCSLLSQVSRYLARNRGLSWY